MARNPRDLTINSEQQLQERLAALREKTDPLKRGLSGSDGAAGAAGDDAGVPYTYSTTTTDSDPGAGFLRFNNTTLSSATSLRISETDGSSNNVAGWLAMWDDSTSTIKGHFLIRKAGDPTVLTIFSLSGTISDQGSWDRFTVAYVAGDTSITNNTQVHIEFFPKGDKGDKGDTGSTGAAGRDGADGDPGAAGPTGPAGGNTFLVRAATTANITISTALNNGDSLDGVTLATGDRVLVKNQSTASQNGIYVVAASPARATDADGAGEFQSGSLVSVSEGTVNADTLWALTTNGTITHGTTGIAFAFAGAAGRMPQFLSAGTQKIAFGSTTFTWAGGTPFTTATRISHGLGVTPTVLITPDGTNVSAWLPIDAWVASLDSTTFSIQARANGQPTKDLRTTVYWLAIG